jgi:hypothetical protein
LTASSKGLGKRQPQHISQFYNSTVPPDVTTSKLCKDSIFGNPVCHCVYKIYDFISVKKLVTFSYVVGIFSQWKFKLISENFILVSQRK